LSHAFAFALLLHQHQAKDPKQQRRLQELFLTLLAVQPTEEQYERNLTCSMNS
jgi:hypothetical protein